MVLVKLLCIKNPGGTNALAMLRIYSGVSVIRQMAVGLDIFMAFGIAHLVGQLGGSLCLLFAVSCLSFYGWLVNLLVWRIPWFRRY